MLQPVSILYTITMQGVPKVKGGSPRTLSYLRGGDDEKNIHVNPFQSDYGLNKYHHIEQN